MSLVCRKQLVLALHLECYSKRQRSIYTARSSFPLTCHLLIIILLTSAPIPHNIWDITLRCFDTVFQRPYRYLSNALKATLSLCDRYRIFTSNWLWIENCENRYYEDDNRQKNFENDKSRIMCDLDQLLKIQH